MLELIAIFPTGEIVRGVATTKAAAREWRRVVTLVAGAEVTFSRPAAG